MEIHPTYTNVYFDVAVFHELHIKVCICYFQSVAILVVYQPHNAVWVASCVTCFVN